MHLPTPFTTSPSLNLPIPYYTTTSSNSSLHLYIFQLFTPLLHPNLLYIFPAPYFTSAFSQLLT
jgi:hypothetical protein